MISIVVAGHAVSNPVEVLESYATKGGTARTLQTYDFGGAGQPNVLTALEVDRTSRIHSRFSHVQRDALVRDAPGNMALWAAVPPQAHLASADPAETDGLYDHMTALYNSLKSEPGVHDAKASKVLHLKRPHLYPLLDSRVVALYRDVATEAAEQYPRRGYKRMYWAAIRNDVVSNRSALGRLRSALAETSGPGHRMSELSDVRLLDILSWRLGH